MQGENLGTLVLRLKAVGEEFSFFINIEFISVSVMTDNLNVYKEITLQLIKLGELKM